MSSPSKFIMSITRFCTSHHTPRILFSKYAKSPEKQRRIMQSSGYRYLSNYTRLIQNHGARRSSSQPGPPSTSQPPSSFLRWILGTSLAIILPFAGNKWGPLLIIKQDVDTVMETIEEIAGVVEKVADVVDTVAENISDGLPEGEKLKKVVDAVEDVAEKAAKNAQTLADAIDKFQEMEDKMENIVETFGDKANEHPKEASS